MRATHVAKRFMSALSLKRPLSWSIGYGEVSSVSLDRFFSFQGEALNLIFFGNGKEASKIGIDEMLINLFLKFQ